MYILGRRGQDGEHLVKELGGRYKKRSEKHLDHIPGYATRFSLKKDEASANFLQAGSRNPSEL